MIKPSFISYVYQGTSKYRIKPSIMYPMYTREPQSIGLSHLLYHTRGPQSIGLRHPMYPMYT